MCVKAQNREARIFEFRGFGRHVKHLSLTLRWQKRSSWDLSSVMHTHPMCPTPPTPPTHIAPIPVAYMNTCCLHEYLDVSFPQAMPPPFQARPCPFRPRCARETSESVLVVTKAHEGTRSVLQHVCGCTKSSPGETREHHAMRDNWACIALVFGTRK